MDHLREASNYLRTLTLRTAGLFFSGNHRSIVADAAQSPVSVEINYHGECELRIYLCSLSVPKTPWIQVEDAEREARRSDRRVGGKG